MIGNGISIWEQRPWKLCSIFGHQIHLFTQQTQWCKVSSLISVWPATLQLWTINLQASDPTVSDQLWAHRTSLNFVNHSKLCNFFLKSYPLFYCCLCPAGIFSDLWILGRQRAGLPKWHRGKESLLCRRWGFNHWVRRNPGGGQGNPLQYSCLENPMDRQAWRVMVHRVAKSQTRLKQLSTHKHTMDYCSAI